MDPLADPLNGHATGTKKGKLPELSFLTDVIAWAKWLAVGAGLIDLANLRGRDPGQAPILGAAKTEPPRRSLTET